MAIRDRIKETVSKAARGPAKRRDKQQAGFGQSGSGSGGFGQAFEDFLSFAKDMRGQASDRMQGEFERLAARLDLVTRREFEAVRAIAIAARTQSEKLAERLEAQLNGGKKPATKTAAAKTPAKKPAKRQPVQRPVKKSSAKKR